MLQTRKRLKQSASRTCAATRRAGRSRASCARGIRTSLHGKKAKRDFFNNLSGPGHPRSRGADGAEQLAGHSIVQITDQGASLPPAQGSASVLH